MCWSTNNSGVTNYVIAVLLGVMFELVTRFQVYYSKMEANHNMFYLTERALSCVFTKTLEDFECMDWDMLSPSVVLVHDLNVWLVRGCVLGVGSIVVFNVLVILIVEFFLLFGVVFLQKWSWYHPSNHMQKSWKLWLSYKLQRKHIFETCAKHIIQEEVYAAICLLSGTHLDRLPIQYQFY